jgi:hypothetical protein
MKRVARERTKSLTSRKLSSVRPLVADSPEDLAQPDFYRPTTPPPNRSGRVPRAAAVAASQTISTTAAATQAAFAAAAQAARPSRSSKRTHDDVDMTPPGSASGEAAPNRDSRAGTPTGRPAKKQRTGSGLRVKNS